MPESRHSCVICAISAKTQKPRHKIFLLSMSSRDISVASVNLGVVDSLYSQGSHDSSTLQQLQVTEELQRQLASMKVQLSELELQLQASLASTYNGSFIWRIPDVTRRRRDAIDGRVTSIYSPPFYTGRWVC